MRICHQLLLLSQQLASVEWTTLTLIVKKQFLHQLSVVPDEVPSHNDFYNFVTVSQRINHTSGRRKKMPTYHLISWYSANSQRSCQRFRINRLTHVARENVGLPNKNPERSWRIAPSQEMMKIWKHVCIVPRCMVRQNGWNAGNVAHFECAGVDDNVYNFVCDLCT